MGMFEMRWNSTLTIGTEAGTEFTAGCRPGKVVVRVLDPTSATEIGTMMTPDEARTIGELLLAAAEGAEVGATGGRR